MGVTSVGIIVEREIAAAGDTYAAIPDVHSVQSPQGTTDEIDVTAFDSANGFEEVVSGIRRGGSIQLEIHYDGANTQHQLLSDDFIAGDTALRRWHITWPDSAATTLLEFYGWVSGYSIAASVGGAQTLSVTIRCTGTPDYDHT